ncbi:MAG: Acyl-ACP thioesterase [Thermocaproicibacter melissae]|uniref:acyl-[acyl-carrier-protein] thioesterase n=1 Tax=Thermocaproicibacter melissae TaxID=2966552 RepID=UPI003A103ACD
MSPEIINEYSRSLNVPVYDVGPTNTLKFGSALRLVQETSEQHLNVMHAGYETMKKTAGLVFFIISTRVHIFHFPGNGEPITIKTHPRGRGGAQLYRDFKFYDAKGDLLLDVMQTTVLADAVTHKVQRPQALKQFGFYPEDIVEPENRMERFSVPDGLPLLGVRRVFYSDLDANGHMNNSVYGDIVWDFLPPDVRRKAHTIQINYLREVNEGKDLEISGEKIGGKFFLRGDCDGSVRFTASAKS